MTFFAGVKKALKNVFDLGVVEISHMLEEVGPADAHDRAYHRGHFTIYDKEGSIVLKGK